MLLLAGTNYTFLVRILYAIAEEYKKNNVNDKCQLEQLILFINKNYSSQTVETNRIINPSTQMSFCK